MGKATLACQRANGLLGQGRIDKLYDEGKAIMKTCIDCGGEVRGWTCPSLHDQCAACATKRALGRPVPERNAPLTYWQKYYRRKKLGKKGRVL